MKLKILELRRGKSKNIVKCENGDMYDSQAQLYDWQGKSLYLSDHWNTDATVSYKGGRLAPCTCFGIKGKRKVSYQDEPINVIKLFSSKGIDIEKIHSEDDIPDENWVLVSDISNPNHKTKVHPEGEMIIEFVQCHPGSLKWDWSHGCQTALNYGGYTDFDGLDKLLADGEKIIFTLV